MARFHSSLRLIFHCMCVLCLPITFFFTHSSVHGLSGNEFEQTPDERGTSHASVHGVTKSWTQWLFVSDWTTITTATTNSWALCKCCKEHRNVCIFYISIFGYFLINTRVESLDHMVVLFLIFWGIPYWLHQFTFPSAVHKGSFSPHPLFSFWQ